MPGASVDFDWDSVYADDEREDQSMLNLQRRIDEEVDRRCSEKVQKAIIRLLAQIVDSDNYRLKIDVSIMASGFPFYEGKSFTEMGQKHKISKQAFSKHVLKFQDELGLPPTRCQKSKAARETYRKLKRPNNNQKQQYEHCNDRVRNA